jgi:hypothetical protein
VAAFPVKIVAGGPTITSVTPKAWWASRKQDITITGTNFLTASDPHGPTKLTVTEASGSVEVTDVNVVSATEITATVKASKDSPAGLATVTVTNQASGQHPGFGNYQQPILPQPILYWPSQSSSPISGDGAAVQNADAGQPVNLTTNVSPPATLPGGITISPNTWTVGGTNIANYTPSDGKTDPPTPTVKNGPTLSTYWVYEKSGIKVRYKYCVSVSGLDNPCSDEVAATFDITGPGDGQMATDPQYSMSITILKGPPCVPITLEYFLKYGHFTGWDSEYCRSVGPEAGTPGIEFTSPQGSSSGTYSFVQIITESTVTYSEGRAGSVTCPTNPGLDGTLPYAIGNGVTTSDSPDVPLESYQSSVRRDFKATMYMMWTSSQPGSILVPISSQSWLFMNAKATNSGFPNTQNWDDPTWGQIGLDGDPKNYVATAPSTPPYGYPTWGGPATPVANPNCPTNASNEAEE